MMTHCRTCFKVYDDNTTLARCPHLLREIEKPAAFLDENVKILSCVGTRRQWLSCAGVLLCITGGIWLGVSLAGDSARVFDVVMGGASLYAGGMCNSIAFVRMKP